MNEKPTWDRGTTTTDLVCEVMDRYEKPLNAAIKVGPEEAKKLVDRYEDLLRKDTEISAVLKTHLAVWLKIFRGSLYRSERKMDEALSVFKEARTEVRELERTSNRSDPCFCNEALLASFLASETASRMGDLANAISIVRELQEEIPDRCYGEESRTEIVEWVTRYGNELGYENLGARNRRCETAPGSDQVPHLGDVWRTLVPAPSRSRQTFRTICEYQKDACAKAESEEKKIEALRVVEDALITWSKAESNVVDLQYERYEVSLFSIKVKASTAPTEETRSTLLQVIGNLASASGGDEDNNLPGNILDVVRPLLDTAEVLARDSSLENPKLDKLQVALEYASVASGLMVLERTEQPVTQADAIAAYRAAEIISFCYRAAGITALADLEEALQAAIANELILKDPNNDWARRKITENSRKNTELPADIVAEVNSWNWLVVPLL